MVHAQVCIEFTNIDIDSLRNAMIMLFGMLASVVTSTGATSSTFNVVDYGAKGDDSTNNTAAFSACLEALVAAGGGRMYLCVRTSESFGTAPRNNGLSTHAVFIIGAED
jgi:polygalacturonase